MKWADVAAGIKKKFRSVGSVPKAVGKFNHDDVWVYYTRNRDWLYLTYYSAADDEVKHVKTKIEPEVFVETSTPGGMKSWDGRDLKPLTPESIGKSSSRPSSFLYSLDEHPEKVYGYRNQALPTLFKHFDYEAVNSNWSLDHFRIGFIDIETESENGFARPDSANERVNAITIFDSKTKTFYSFGTQEIDGLDDTTDDHGYKIRYFNCGSELNLFIQFHSFLHRAKFTIISGWFSNGFDIPYLIRRFEKLFAGLKAVDESAYSKIFNAWSPFGLEPYVDLVKKKIKIPGVLCLDYMEVYDKNTFDPRENFKLDTIANIELGDEKLKHPSGIEGHLLYRDYYEDFIRYNLKDVQLIVRLENNKNFFFAMAALGYLTFSNLDEVTAAIRLNENLIYTHLRRQNRIMPFTIKEIGGTDYAGAFVFEPQVGRHNWVITLDVSSEYPSLMRALNISPETFLPDHQQVFVDDGEWPSVDDFLDGKVDTSICKDHNISVAASGWAFTNERQGFIPEIVAFLLSERKGAKKKMLEWAQKVENSSGDEKKKAKHKQSFYKARQLALKLAANSIYGAMGNSHFCFSDVRLAESITLSGQLFIRNAAKFVNEYMNKILKTDGVNYVVFGDTDSIGVRLDDIVKKIPTKDVKKIVDVLDQFVEKRIQPVVNDSIAHFCEYMHAYEPDVLAMKREVISTTAIFLAKKKYVMNKIMDETVVYDLPGKLKITGIDAIRSNISKTIRDWLLDDIKFIVQVGDYDKVKEMTAKRLDQFMKLPINDRAVNISANNIEKYDVSMLTSKAHVPYHISGALAHNFLISKMGLEKKYPPIIGGKIKIIKLKKGNPYGFKYIAWGDEFPKEFELDEFIDMSYQFDLVYKAPLQRIADAEGEEVARPRTSKLGFFT
jgi:DNA polymerase elongation subunit (family B)